MTEENKNKQQDSQEETPVRTSKITKRIARTYNIAKYESLTIDVGFEEEITWTTPAERRTKSNNLNKILVREFNEAKQVAFGKMNCAEQKVFAEDKRKELEEKQLEKDREKWSEELGDQLDTGD